MGYTYDSVYEDEDEDYENDQRYAQHGQDVGDLEGEHLGEEGHHHYQEQDYGVEAYDEASLDQAVNKMSLQEKPEETKAQAQTTTANEEDEFTLSSGKVGK